jgi:hypothetical protein
MTNKSSLLAAGRQRSLDRVEYQVEMFAHILGEEAQDEIAVLLEQLIPATIPAVRIDAFQVLPAVQLDRDTRIAAQQINLHPAPIVEWDRELGI